MEARYIYNRYIPKGEIAGGHYHLHKKEVFCVPLGQEAEVFLEDPKTKETKTVMISNMPEDEFVTLIYIRLGVAHVVRSLDQPLSLIVFSNVPEHDKEDDYPYTFTK